MVSTVSSSVLHRSLVHSGIGFFRNPFASLICPINFPITLWIYYQINGHWFIEYFGQCVFAVSVLQDILINNWCKIHLMKKVLYNIYCIVVFRYIIFSRASLCVLVLCIVATPLLLFLQVVLLSEFDS